MAAGNPGQEKRKKTDGQGETTGLDQERPRGGVGRAAKKIIAN
jgi:hypothetical protein